MVQKAILLVLIIAIFFMGCQFAASDKTNRSYRTTYHGYYYFDAVTFGDIVIATLGVICLGIIIVWLYSIDIDSGDPYYSDYYR